ncbi:antiviral reverse transcriptase Drt3b [Pseudomonas putida]|uniref:antiviral reverse transcriptase Drt3b n=1 Tax=Pseudomonas putida TaxID=303 RepID=UPI0023647D3F|nr:antiviral reverse transcriptase Drt3b [Pseudomonas putida]MDD2005975.1 RNA-directed DNA polymerase [Pseudomonas putida]
MPKKALSINFPIQRVVLSDVLPYEVPIVFSNRYFYRFLCEHDVKFSGSKIEWISKDSTLDSLVKMLLGISPSVTVERDTTGAFERSLIDISQTRSEYHSVPFAFFTTHKQDQLRQLALMHPKAQLLVVDFYDQYKELIIYFTGQSSFSLRSPKRVAGCTFIDNRAQIEKQDRLDTLVEVSGENYENLRSFFVYEKFSNVFKFYESKEHLQCERDFKFLTKYDISGCFDGVYTHSLPWAVYGKGYSKVHMSPLRESFASKFDSLMQRVNYNETNGILIGPEVSRIFAEIILQSVDSEVLAQLTGKGWRPDEDFKIYRYVDDYFVFYNNEECCYQAKMLLQEVLKRFKLSLNKGKEETLSRPMITPISIAKKRISDLFDKALTFKVADDIKDGESLPRGELYINRSSLVTDFKSILSTSGVDYGDVLNYSLSVVERKVGALIDGYEKIEKLPGLDKSFSKAIESLLWFVFFVYAVSPKVNTTIKLCRICQRVLSFYADNSIGLSYGSLISQVIYERCRSIIDKYSDGKGARIEVMYLLVLMGQLGRNYRVSENLLARCFGFEEVDGVYVVKNDLDYFSVITLFFYIGKKVRYSRIRVALESCVLRRFASDRDALIGSSEMTHMALDLLVCPYVSREAKDIIVGYYGMAGSDISRIQRYNDYWFTKWADFDFSKELDAKVSQEVY